MRRSERRILRRPVVGLLVAALVVALAAVSVIGARGMQASAANAVVKQGAFPGWSYKAVREEDGFVLSKVTYDSNSVAGVKAYAGANADLAQRLIGQGQPALDVEITFRRLLSAEKLRDVVGHSGLPLARIAGYHMRAVGADGQWLTMGGGPANGELIGQREVIDKQMANVRRHTPDAQFQGVAYIEATLTPAEYQRLAADGRVFMIDVTKTLIRAEVGKVVPLKRPHDIGFDVATPFWVMQQLGLENFR